MDKKLILSVIITLVFCVAGYQLMYHDIIGYGSSLFVFLPFLLGYILGRPRLRKVSLIGLLISIGLFCVLLLFGSLEGMVCVLMALPLVLIGVGAGVAAQAVVNRKRTVTDDEDDLVKSSVIPLVLFIGIGWLEHTMTKEKLAVIPVQTELILPYTPMQVYDAIKSVDTVIAEKSLLMRLDLPVPVKCVLKNEAVGGERICYFTGGNITEQITALEKGKVMKMDVTSYELTGRRWLGFREAIYYFDAIGPDSCRLTRITTYTSSLRPGFYWRPLEKWGIEQEHEYVFEDLKRRLEFVWVE